MHNTATSPCVQHCQHGAGAQARALSKCHNLYVCIKLTQDKEETRPIRCIAYKNMHDEGTAVTWTGNLDLLTVDNDLHLHNIGAV